MAELTFNSPGVYTREIDLSQPTVTGPTGVPAGVIGCSLRGPAFVPVTVADFTSFISVFGNTDGEKFGPMAMREWLRSARAGTFTRVLGVGDGKARNSTGTVTNSGFVVGGEQVKANGFLGVNPNAFSAAEDLAAFDAAKDVADNKSGAALGKTYILGCFMSESAGSTIFQDAGYKPNVLPNTAASCTIVCVSDTPADYDGGSPTAVTLISTDGTSRTYEFAVGGAKATGEVVAGTTIRVQVNGLGSAAAVAAQLKSAIENGNGHGTKFLVTIDSATLTIKQTVAGDSGNTTIAAVTNGNASDLTVNGGIVETAFSGGTNGGSIPIVRGVIMAASGVVVTMSSSLTPDNTFADGTKIAMDSFSGGSTTRLRGRPIGDVHEDGTQKFELFLNGLKDKSKRHKTLSFDPTSDSYFGKQLNKEPNKLQEEGIVLYAHYDVRAEHAIPKQHHTPAAKNGLHFRSAGGRPRIAVGFVLTSSEGRNTGSLSNSTSGIRSGISGFVGRPNFENFEDRFTHAATPFVISQKFGGKARSLFRFHSLDAGKVGAGSYKITIENIKNSENPNTLYGTFDVLVRKIDDTDGNRVIVDNFLGCDLNPASDNYIERRIGSRHVFFDFDKKSGGQKIVESPGYPNRSNFIRVEMSDYMKANPEVSAMPMGFRGIGHLVTSGTAAPFGAPASGKYSENRTTIFAMGPSGSLAFGATGLALKDLRQPPVPMREHIALDTNDGPNPVLTWGIQFTQKTSLSQPNKASKMDASILSFVKHFPGHMKSAQPAFVSNNPGTPDAGGSVLDCDRFNNNQFSLENIEVIQKTVNNTTKPDPDNWYKARYRRNKALVGTMTDVLGVSRTSRFLKAEDLSDTETQRFAKFTFPFVGGFDGLNIFDREKSMLSDLAARREMDDTNQGQKSGPTVAAFRKAIDIMEERADVDIQVLAIPGLKLPAITDYAVAATERRFDAIYIMDIETKDAENNFMTSSGPPFANVQNTVNRFASRNLDSSFAAAYFPDVFVTDPGIDNAPVQVPPSVAVLGAYSLNDRRRASWFAPAGNTGGELATTTETQVKFKRSNLDNLYINKINPITEVQGRGLVIFGQKTLQAAQSALDRVNVRRLLIDIRRKVRGVANGLLFEPNRDETLIRFNNAVLPILSNIQQGQGLDAFQVQIDATTTTQADVENNTIRGKIFLQPTRTVEVISLDFVVTNAGVE